MWSQLIRADPLQRFNKSRFRRKFHLNSEDLFTIKLKGIVDLRQDAIYILNNRIKNRPLNDGKQTPYKGHPVFKAMHATACCCRKCIEKWHKIPRNKPLNKSEINLLAGIIVMWIKKEIRNNYKLKANPFMDGSKD